MVSDILSDAVQEIQNWQKADYAPKCYKEGEAARIIQHCVDVMTATRVYLDSIPAKKD